MFFYKALAKIELSAELGGAHSARSIFTFIFQLIG